MAGSWSLILVRYGEIGIKSRTVRQRWERRLADNVEEALARRGGEGYVKRERGRLFLHASDTAIASDALRHTFGVVSASEVVELPTDLPGIAERMGEASRGVVPVGGSFAVRARRTGEHPFTSMEVQRTVGSAVWRANEDRKPRVDLTNPDVEFHVEIRENAAYSFREVVPGPGGLPLGTQGKVGIVLDSPRAALAAWTVMRRGATPLFVAPADAVDATPLADAVRALSSWAPMIRLMRVPVPDAWREGARRRAFLLTAAGAFTRPRRGHAVVVGDGLEGAAARAMMDALPHLPVLRPLTGYAGDALAALARLAEIPHVEEERDEDEVAEAPDVPREDVRDALRASTTQEVRAA